MALGRYRSYHEALGEMGEKRSKSASMYKECIRVSAKSNDDTAKKNKQKIKSSWGEIDKFFKKNIEEIQALRMSIDEYPSKSATRRYEIYKQCQIMFKDFRQSTGIGGAPEEAAPEDAAPLKVAIFGTDISGFHDLVRYNNCNGYRYMEESKYGCARTAKGKSKWICLVKRGITQIYETGLTPHFWPKNSEQFAEMAHSYVTGVESAQKEMDDVSEFCKSMAGKVDELDRYCVSSEGWHNIVKLLGNLFEAGRTQIESSKYRNWEENLDRVFHMTFVIWQAIKHSKKQVILFDVLVNKLEAIFNCTVEEKYAIQLMKFCRVRTLKHIGDFMEAENEKMSKKYHRHHHPMIITAKRFVNGLAAVSRAGSLRQILSSLKPNCPESTKLMTDLFEKELLKADKGDDLISTWIWRNYLEQKCDALYGPG